MRKLIIAGLSAGILAVGAAPAFAGAINPGPPPSQGTATGCVASNPNAAGDPTGQLPDTSNACTFTSDGASTNGYAGVLGQGGSFTITHKNALGHTVVDASGNTPGPVVGAPGSVTFVLGVDYTLTVNGSGGLAAGDGNQTN